VQIQFKFQLCFSQIKLNYFLINKIFYLMILKHVKLQEKHILDPLVIIHLSTMNGAT
jgi:hypothetical protein